MSTDNHCYLMKLECHPNTNIILIPFPLFTSKSLYWVGIPNKKATCKRQPNINSLLLFAGFWHPARGICMNLQKQWKCFNGGSEVRCMTNDSVINDTSLKTIVDSENFVAIILDDLK